MSSEIKAQTKQMHAFWTIQRTKAALDASLLAIHTIGKGEEGVNTALERLSLLEEQLLAYKKLLCQP